MTTTNLNCDPLCWGRSSPCCDVRLCSSTLQGQEMYRADQQPSVAEEGQSLAAALRCSASGHRKPYAKEVGGGVVEGNIGKRSNMPLLHKFGSPNEGLHFTSGMNAMREKSSLLFLFRTGRWGTQFICRCCSGVRPSCKLRVVQHRRQVEGWASFPSH